MKPDNSLSLDIKEFPLLFSGNKRLPVYALILFAFVLILIFYFGIYLQNEYIVLGIICGLILSYFFIKYPRFWLYTVTLSLFIFFRNSEGGVSVLDIISGLLYLVTLFVWLIWQLAILRNKLVTNIGDWFILAFYILLLGNSIIAVANGVTFLDWVREYSILALVLYYFPIRHYFREEKYLKRLLFLLAIVCVLTDLQQFYDYYRIGIVNVVYAYEMMYSARINQSLYTSATAIGILFVLYEKKFSKQILILIFTLLNGLALVTSFSRTFWIIIIFEILLFIILVPLKQRLKLLTYIIIFIGALTFSLFIVFRESATVALKVIENRLTSSTQGRKDPSVEGRFIEYQLVLRNISELPFGGNGLTKTISFIDPFKQVTKHTTTIHNGYLYLFHRIGIPLSLFYIFFLLYFSVKSFLLFFKSKENLYKVLSLGSFCALFIMIVSNFSSTQFCVRDGAFILAYVFAFYSISKQNQINLINVNKASNSM